MEITGLLFDPITTMMVRKKKRITSKTKRRQSNRLLDMNARREAEQEITKLHKEKFPLLREIIKNPDYFDWEEHAKVSNIWIPFEDNMPSDSESDDSSAGHDPTADKRHRCLKTQRDWAKLQTTEQVVKDLVECVISPSHRFVMKVFREENGGVNKYLLSGIQL